MKTKWPVSDWTKARFFLWAALLTALQGLDYLRPLPVLLKVVLFGDLCILFVVVAFQERHSLPYQLAALGVILATFVFMIPPGLIPATPWVFAVWDEILLLLAGTAISIGTLLYAWTLLTRPRGRRDLKRIAPPWV